MLLQLLNSAISNIVLLHCNYTSTCVHLGEPHVYSHMMCWESLIYYGKGFSTFPPHPPLFPTCLGEETACFLGLPLFLRCATRVVCFFERCRSRNVIRSNSPCRIVRCYLGCARAIIKCSSKCHQKCFKNHLQQ